MIQLYKNILPDDLVKDLLKYYESYEPIDYGNFTQVEIDTKHKLTDYVKDIVYKVTDHCSNSFDYSYSRVIVIVI